MSYIDQANKIADAFVQEHDDVILRTYDNIPDMVRIRMFTKNGDKIIEKCITYKTLLSASGYFVVSHTLNEMYKELKKVTLINGGGRA